MGLSCGRPTKWYVRRPTGKGQSSPRSSRRSEVFPEPFAPTIA
jgi:hypothetical protein